MLALMGLYFSRKNSFDAEKIKHYVLAHPDFKKNQLTITNKKYF